MELTVQEKNHAIWHKIDAHLSELITNAQRKNEAPLDPVTTAEIRGRIRAYRLLLSLGDDVPIANEDEEPVARF
jgi:hypothetical protein